MQISGSSPSAKIEARADCFRLVVGLFAVFGLFHVSATMLGSDRGQRGILIGTLIVAATAAAERFLPGLFAQAGIAEEVLFRGYLFGHLRVGRTFWRAAAVSMLPFVSVHLVLFLSMPWPIALASVLLAVVISFPLARLFELGGNTIWAPALLHFVIQATVKIVVFPHGAQSFALAWMAASAIVPLLVFTVKAPARR
jgi:membrane protease YdiL (CAAX protease family)